MGCGVHRSNESTQRTTRFTFSRQSEGSEAPSVSRLAKSADYSYVGPPKPSGAEETAAG